MKTATNSFRFLSILVIASLIAVSCTKTIEGDLPGGEPELVVDANIETNAPPIVLLTKSSSVFGGINLNDLSAFFVHNADVWVRDLANNDSVRLTEFCLNDLPFDDTTKIQILESMGFIAQDSGDVPNACSYTVPDILTYYTTGTCSFYGQMLHTYSLSINTEKFHSYGETSLPQSLPPDSLGYSPLPNPNYDTLVNVFVYASVPDNLGHFVRYWTKRNNEQFYTPYPSVWDDKLFSGNYVRLPISRGEPSNAESSDADGYYWWGDTVTIKWANIDYKTYNFFNTLENDGSRSPFSTQVRVQSNMSGAIGVFAGYSVSYVSTVIPQHP